MEVNVQAERRAEVLDEGHEAGLAIRPAGLAQMARQLVEEDRQRLRLQLRVAGQAMVQVGRHRQHVLAQRDMREHRIGQVRRPRAVPAL